MKFYMVTCLIDAVRPIGFFHNLEDAIACLQKQLSPTERVDVYTQDDEEMLHRDKFPHEIPPEDFFNNWIDTPSTAFLITEQKFSD